MRPDRAILIGLLLAASGGCARNTRERDVSFANGPVTLAGTLVLPRTPGPYPGVVLVHGSGPETRKLYLRYAREYAKAGVAALAYDKRGSGKSTKASPRASYDVLAGDVLAAVGFLRSQPTVDSSRIGLFGLSEGEWVAPLAAAKMRHPAFLILVSASAETPAGQVRTEVGKNLMSKGHADSIVRTGMALYERLSRFQRDGSGRDELNAALAAAARQPWFRDAKYLDARVPQYDRVQQLPWFRVWHANMDFDALPLIAELDCPVLVLLGGKDLKNDARTAASRYEAVVRRKPGRVFEARIFADASHAMLVWWLPFHLPPPRYPSGYFETQVEWLEKVLAMR